VPPLGRNQLFDGAVPFICRRRPRPFLGLVDINACRDHGDSQRTSCARCLGGKTRFTARALAVHLTWLMSFSVSMCLLVASKALKSLAMLSMGQF
jgi:hypothetical protein